MFDLEAAEEISQLVGDPPALDPDEIWPEFKVLPDSQQIFASLAHDLNNAAFEYAAAARRQTSASPGMIAQRASRVAKACDRLLDELGVAEDGGEIADSLGPGAMYAFAYLEDTERGGKQQVVDAIGCIFSLRKWALATAKMAEQSPTNRAAVGNSKDLAQDHLWGRLGSIYVKYWGKAPGLSRSGLDSSIDGPFVRFAEYAFEKIAEKGWESREGLVAAMGRSQALQRFKQGMVQFLEGNF